MWKAQKAKMASHLAASWASDGHGFGEMLQMDGISVFFLFGMNIGRFKRFLPPWLLA